MCASREFLFVGVDLCTTLCMRCTTWGLRCGKGMVWGVLCVAVVSVGDPVCGGCGI